MQSYWGGDKLYKRQQHMQWNMKQNSNSSVVMQSYWGGDKLYKRRQHQAVKHETKL